MFPVHANLSHSVSLITRIIYFIYVFWDICLLPLPYLITYCHSETRVFNANLTLVLCNKAENVFTYKRQTLK